MLQMAHLAAFGEVEAGRADLAEQMKQHLLRAGGAIREGEAARLECGGKDKAVWLKDGTRLTGPAVIIAAGGSRRKLGVEGEERLAGRGVSYCAVCDGAFFRGKKVAVIGGGNSALEEALYLSRITGHCYLVHRRDAFRGSATLQAEVRRQRGIECVLSAVVDRIEGENKVERLLVKFKAGGERRLEVDGIFVSIGQKPNTEFAVGQLAMNEAGYIVTDEEMAASAPGVFACGDARKKGLYQVVTACGDGAVAAVSAEKYLHNAECGVRSAE